MRITASAAHVLESGIQRYGSGWSWKTSDAPAATWDGFILGSCFEGHASLCQGDSSYALRRGSVYLLRLSSRSVYTLQNTAKGPVVLAWVHMHYRRPRPLQLPPVHTTVDEPIFWEQLMHRTIAADSKGDSDGADFWLDVALTELAQQSGRRIVAPSAVDEPYVSFLRELCREIRVHPGYPWSLKMMADRVGVSTSHFIRLFREYQNTSPTAYVIEARMGAAKSYLQTTPWSIALIAETLGFCDQFAFSRRFRRRWGMSPSQFRGSGGTHL